MPDLWDVKRPEDLVPVVEHSATESGERPEVLASVLAAALTRADAVTQMRVELTHRWEADHESLRVYLRAVERLQLGLRGIAAELRASCPDEVPSSEVRKHWATILDRVHADDETVYVTQHGRRIAALVPPYVAEQYEADQAWFHTQEWQEREAEADADVTADRTKSFDSEEDFLAAIAAVEDE